MWHRCYLRRSVQESESCSPAHWKIGLGDGTVRRFGSGAARLVEDTTGKGHTTRAVGNAPVLTAVVPLAA